MAGQYDAYTNSRVNTISKVGLVVMLYEGAIKFLSLAVHSIKEKQFYEKAQNINKSLKIIEELQNSLNFEQGGEISENLNKLYVFFLKEISTAGMKNNQQSLNKVINLLSEMKQSWEKVENQQAVQLAEQANLAQELRISG